ncbi:MAG: FecR domain-containing protein, partial [Lachnospiraceae bacterium]|nr:FecR domain-containing protein [Lachnospiraceae bacterium]
MSKDNGDITENLKSADIKENDKKKKKRIIIAIASALLVALLSVGIFVYRDQFMAITMRIQRLVGTVNLYNEGEQQELREKMRLGAGQTVETAGESLIMVSLDDTKLMTMEESSKADIKARGKKLEFDLIEGNLFFNVTEKLKKRESFDIHTSTMICGIRGTSAYVGRDSTSHETLMVTDGIVGVDATNPVTLESIHEDVHAGEMITIYLDEEAEGNKTISIVKKTFREEDLPSLALDAIRKSPELQKRIAKAAGFSADRLVALADATSKAGVSMYGSAADKLSADGIKDAIPIMGYNAQIMVRTANRAVDTAGEDLPLEIAIIKGLNGTMNAGIEAGYKGEPLGALVDSAADCMEACIKGAREAGLGSNDLVTVSDSVTGALQSSVGEMAKANLSTSEITQVVSAIETVYTEAIASGAAAGTNTDSSAASGSSSKTAATDSILAAVGNASDYITNTVDSEMLKQSTGEETAAELLKKARAAENKKDEGQTQSANTRQANRPVALGTENGQNGTGIAGATSANAQASTDGGSGAGTTAASAASTSSSGSSNEGSSSGSGGSGSNSGGNQNGGNPGSAPVVYGDMTIAGGITGGTVSTPLAAGSAPAQGDTVTLNLAPNVGHSFNSLTVNTVDDNGNITGSVNTTEVTAGSQYTFVMPTEKIVVNASFTPNTYNVNLNLSNDITVASGSISQYTYGTAVALPTQVTKASDNFFNYTFAEWTDAPTGGNAVTGISAT